MENTRADAMDAESVRGRMNALRSGQARVEQVGYWHGPSGCLDATLAPEDPGVLQVPARDWRRMTQYEKCLFCWTEVNLLALEFHEKYPAVPYHRVRFDDLLSADGSHFEQLVGFMMLPPNPTLVDAASNRVDAHHKKARPVDWRLVFGHPQTVELARRLGYPLDDFSDSALTRRYFKWRRLAKARRSVVRAFRRIVLG